MIAAWIIMGGIVGFWFGRLSADDARDASESETPSRLE